MQQFRQPAIEKVEAHGNVGSEAVELIPHEVGQDNEHLEPRARQNVLIQWRFFIGIPGCHSVFCLKKGCRNS
jgi:hypothetical protein